MSRIIITGTKGFIGKNLISHLKNNNQILEINEDVFQESEWINNIKNQLLDFNPDVIFHVGACSDTLEQNVNYMMKVNYLFTKILSDHCKSTNCKLIFSSSAANYGDNGLHPSNLYGWSKFVAEQYVIQNGGIALRYFNVYGPMEDHKGKMASVAFQMLQKKKNNEEIKLFPHKPKRDFVYVEDVISANLYAMNHYENLSYNWYEVGSGEARTFEDVLDILDIKYDYHDENKIPNGYQFFTQSDSTKWMNGWESKYKIEDGLKKYSSWLNKEGLN